MADPQPSLVIHGRARRGMLGDICALVARHASRLAFSRRIARLVGVYRRVFVLNELWVLRFARAMHAGS